MWKDYSKSYLKQNRASGRTMIAAALIASFFLSMCCSLAYNFWVYEIERITLEEGDWQARIAGELNAEELSLIKSFANVSKVVAEREKREPVTDIYFRKKQRIYEDMPLILNALGRGENEAEYHETLLSNYLIHDPKDDTPPLLLTFYLLLLFLASCSIILMIHNSFELSMNARIHQFGILSSIGATPKQIRICLLQEAAVLCGIPILLGSVAGTAASAVVLRAINYFAADVAGRHQAVFHDHIAVFLLSVLVSVFTVFISAWIPSKKLSRLSPLEAIRNSGDLKVEKSRRHLLSFALFGVEGELALSSLQAQKKSLRLSSLSLLFSFLAFSIMLVFTTLSGISTRYTYFERYKNSWDIMVTVKDTDILDFHLAEKIRGLDGVYDAAVYQKAEGTTWIEKDWQSDELFALGGLPLVGGVTEKDGKYQVKAPIVVLDDTAFFNYCSQIGIVGNCKGVVVQNQIWDSVNSNFRDARYIPFVKENRKMSVLYCGSDEEIMAELPILAYTKQVPILREEYEDFALVHFISASAYDQISKEFGTKEKDAYIRILAKNRDSLLKLNQLERSVSNLLEPEYEIVSENRIQEKITNDTMQKGAVMIFGGFCILLALIGIVNVFSYTLGFLRQRKGEFARYAAIGLSPGQMRKMFLVEAFTVAGKPLLLTLFLTGAAAQWMIKLSYLDPMAFWREAPILPIAVFAAAIVFFVGLAYLIGGRRLLRCGLLDHSYCSLRDQ